MMGVAFLPVPTLPDFLFQHTAVVSRNTPTRGAAGGSINTPAVVATVLCLLQELSAQETTKLKAEGMDVSHALYTKTDPLADERCDIVVTDRAGNTLAARLIVRGVLNYDHQNRLWRINCTKHSDVDGR